MDRDGKARVGRTEKTALTYIHFARGSAVKIPPAVKEAQVQSLGQEDPLVKGMAAHSNILAWRIPWTEEPPARHSDNLEGCRLKREGVCVCVYIYIYIYIYIKLHLRI